MSAAPSQIPYPESFFPKPKQIAPTRADMLAILEKRNHKVTYAEPISVSVQPRLSALGWLPKREGESFIESECGRFTITGFDEGYALRHLAFLRSIPAGWPERGESRSRELLGGYETATAAKAACQERA